MAGEIQIQYQHGKTLYALIRNRIGQIWNTGTLAFEAYSSLNYALYPVSLTEQGSSGFYTGTFPATIPPGVYGIVVFNQVGGSPSETADSQVGNGDEQWNGTATASLADVATSGQVAQFLPTVIFRGQMVKNFMFKLVSAADGRTPFVSGVISGMINKDAGGFGPLQSGAYTEQGFGWYSLQALTSGDLLANSVALRFIGTSISGGDADPKDFAIYLQRVSGQ